MGTRRERYMKPVRWADFLVEISELEFKVRKFFGLNSYVKVDYDG